MLIIHYFTGVWVFNSSLFCTIWMHQSWHKYLMYLVELFPFWSDLLSHFFTWSLLYWIRVATLVFSSIFMIHQLPSFTLSLQLFLPIRFISLWSILSIFCSADLIVINISAYLRRLGLWRITARYGILVDSFLSKLGIHHSKPSWILEFVLRNRSNPNGLVSCPDIILLRFLQFYPYFTC